MLTRQPPRMLAGTCRQKIKLACLGMAICLLGSAAGLSAETPSSATQQEVQKGLDALRQGNYASAEKSFVAALQASPARWDVHLDLGLSYYHQQKFSQAISELQTVLQHDPSQQTAKAYLLSSLAATGRCAQAKSGLEQEFGLDQDPKQKRLLGLTLLHCLVEADEPAEAEVVSSRLVAQFPDDPDVLYEAGRFYGSLSSELLLHLMDVAPNSGRFFQAMGDGAAANGDWQKALAAYRQALRVQPSLPEVRQQIATLLLEHSTDPMAWREALNYLNEELKVYPGNAQAEYDIGEVYLRHGQLNPATAALERAVQLNPVFVRARVELAKALRIEGKTREALAVLEPARRIEPNNPSVHYLLAQLYRALGEKAEADREQNVLERLQSSSFRSGETKATKPSR